jgi:glycosyltransferase involved in cell wall biosynthesis
VGLRSREARRICFVTWTPHHRASELARALGGEIYQPSPVRRNWPAAVRYVLQAAQTVAHLVRVRPREVLFTNPPFVAGVVLVLSGRLLGFRVWADSHSGAFNDPRWARFARANSWMMRRCAGVIVTNKHLARLVRDAGGRPIIVNYPATDHREREPTGDPALVATLGFLFDEPIDELLEAATLAPNVRLVLTGPAPPSLRAKAPPNCTITGWLRRRDYERTLARARGVICLTTREDTMQTGAFEALQYSLPMVLSGTEALRSFFHRGVIFVDDHDPATLASALVRLWDEHELLSDEAVQARDEALSRCAREVEALRIALHTPS